MFNSVKKVQNLVKNVPDDKINRAADLVKVFKERIVKAGGFSNNAKKQRGERYYGIN